MPPNIPKSDMFGNCFSLGTACMPVCLFVRLSICSTKFSSLVISPDANFIFDMHTLLLKAFDMKPTLWIWHWPTFVPISLTRLYHKNVLQTYFNKFIIEDIWNEYKCIGMGISPNWMYIMRSQTDICLQGRDDKERIRRAEHSGGDTQISVGSAKQRGTARQRTYIMCQVGRLEHSSGNTEISACSP